MTTSNFKFSIITVLAFVTLLFTSCDKNEDFGEEGHLPGQQQNFVGAFTATGEEDSVDSTDIDVLCFDFQYPINVSFPEGETVSFDDEAVLWEAIDTWYESNPNSEGDPSIVFPVTVTFEDGSVENIATDEDLCDLYFECYDEWEDEEEWEDYEEGEWEEECPDDYDLCFDVVFPVGILIGDVAYTVNSFEEADSLVYGVIDSLDQDDDLDISLAFPIDVVLEDGTQVTLLNDEDLDDLEESCHDNEDFEDYEEWMEDYSDICFDIVFPVSLEINGQVYALNSFEEADSLVSIIIEGLGENDDLEIDLVFPIDVILEDGAQVTILNLEDLENLEESCDGYEGDDLDFCFDIEYPISILFPDGSSVEANNDQDIVIALNEWDVRNPDNDDDIYPVFPVSVVVDSSTQVINNAEEFETLLDSCD